MHCAAVPTGWYRGYDAHDVVGIVRGWHKQQGWADIGYHYVVMPDGEVAPGRPLAVVGAHCYGRNSRTVGILMIERVKVDAVRGFHDYFTNEQLEAVRDIVKDHQFIKVTGHNDFAAKLCPGFKVVGPYFGAKV